jgi:hypothetical protein
MRQFRRKMASGAMSACPGRADYKRHVKQKSRVELSCRKALPGHSLPEKD